MRNLAIFFVLVFWVATVYWVYKDARRRIEDPLLVWRRDRARRRPPFIGPLIYMLFRPPEYLEDVRERELEIKAMESGSAAATCTARSAAPRSSRTSSSAPSARRGCARRARTAAPLEAALAGLPVLRDAGRATPTRSRRARRGEAPAAHATRRPTR